MANELTKIPKFRRCVLQNFPFIEQDFDALTDYQLLCKVVEYLNKVITSQNEVIEVAESLTAAFNQLQSFVENYFDNLDVQEEINNKLDEMAEDGTLQEIITSYIQANAAWCFDTVADMKLAENLVNGSYARTLGFHTINDGGGALYKITNTGTANEKDVIAVGSLFATLIKPVIVTPEMYGAYGDNTHDDTAIFTYMFSVVDKITTLNKTYKLDSQLAVPEGKELSGAEDSAGYTKFNAVTGIKLAGRKITVKNIEITGANQANYGLYCCGYNEGGSTSGANYVSNVYVKNVILNNFNYGIYFNGVVWDNTFENIRINFCNYGMYNTDTYYIMLTKFIRIYFSGSKINNVDFRKADTQFDNCNFGISATRTISLVNNCNVLINNSNFECDKYISGSLPLIEISGKNLRITNCRFKLCCSSGMSLFNTLGAVQNLTIENCNYTSVNLDSSNALTKFLCDQLTGVKYGCINLGPNNTEFAWNIDSSVPQNKWPFIRLNGLIQTYSTLADLTKIGLGEMAYYRQDNTIKYFNGTEMVSI